MRLSHHSFRWSLRRRLLLRVPKVVITMPAYRAAGTFAPKPSMQFRGSGNELVLVDDASPDHTGRARATDIHVVVHEQNRGCSKSEDVLRNRARGRSGHRRRAAPGYQHEPKAVPLLIGPILSGDPDMTSARGSLGCPTGVKAECPRRRQPARVNHRELDAGRSRFTGMHSGMRASTLRCN
jgi:hypothetical protein